jgi:tight adherence protein B
MTGSSTAATALAAALMTMPSSASLRLVAIGVLTRRRASAAPLNRWLAWAAVGTAAAVVLPPAVVVASGIAVGTMLFRHRKQMTRRRIEQDRRSLEVALDVLVGELRVGAHPVAAFDAAAAEADGACAASFRGVAARALLGADVAAGLRGVAEGSALRSHWEQLAVCWELAHTHGLTIATLMRAAQRDIVERSRLDSQAAAGLAGARATATVLAGLPLVGIALGELIGASPVRFLLAGGPGGWLLVIGITFAAAGMLWSDGIVRRALS